MKMKTLASLFLLSTFSLLLMANRCQTTPDLPDKLWNTWVHSYEDDTDSTKVFRTAGYEFPPARGRERFTLKEDGSFLYYGIAPNDGYAPPTKGSWSAKNENTVQARAGQDISLTIYLQQLKNQEIIEVKQQ